MSLKASNGGLAPQEESSVSFSELVAAHYRWAKELHAEELHVEQGVARPEVAQPKVEDQYHKKLNAFERKHGEISGAYWCQKAPSAVAMTVREKRVLGRHRDADIQLYRVSDWVTAKANVSLIADLLHQGDTLAMKVSTVLKGTPKRVAMQWLLAVQSHLLGFIERSKDDKLDEKELKDLAQREMTELIQIEAYYHRTGDKMARQFYVIGMLMGIVALAALAWLLLWKFGVSDLAWTTDTDTRPFFDTRTFFACYAAGALGAVVSVLSRMTKKNEMGFVDHEIGKYGLYMLGIYRPLIGAITGLAVYFLARTALLQMDPNVKTVDFFVFLAFLAGFSERWAQVLFGGAEKVISERLGKQAGK
ncbi:MAG: hypothetical protein M3495_18560 [Pseudomonadota bacterium]|nr:hypothetical protein [Pseudomonadota bacterium]